MLFVGSVPEMYSPSVLLDLFSVKIKSNEMIPGIINMDGETFSINRRTSMPYFGGFKQS